MINKIALRVFVIGDGDKYNRNCVRIFKREQANEAKAFAREYAMGSMSGAVVEIVLYRDGQAAGRIYSVRRK